MGSSTERSRVRARNLRKLADDHALSANARTTVTSSPVDQTTHLYPHFETVAAACEFAGALIADASFAELPLEVVNLDSGARQIARLGVMAWDSPQR